MTMISEASIRTASRICGKRLQLQPQPLRLLETATKKERRKEGGEQSEFTKSTTNFRLMVRPAALQYDKAAGRS
jgi:hypothetical protein